MKAFKTKALAATALCIGALAVTGTAVAMPVLGARDGTVSKPTYVQPSANGSIAHDAWARDARQVQAPNASQPVSLDTPSDRATPTQAPVVSTGSDVNWGKTIGISAGALALALCLAGLLVLSQRQRKAQPGF